MKVYSRGEDYFSRFPQLDLKKGPTNCLFRERAETIFIRPGLIIASGSSSWCLSQGIIQFLVIFTFTNPVG